MPICLSFVQVKRTPSVRGMPISPPQLNFSTNSTPQDKMTNVGVGARPLPAPPGEFFRICVTENQILIHHGIKFAKKSVLFYVDLNLVTFYLARLRRCSGGKYNREEDCADSSSTNSPSTESTFIQIQRYIPECICTGSSVSSTEGRHVPDATSLWCEWCSCRSDSSHTEEFHRTTIQVINMTLQIHQVP